MLGLAESYLDLHSHAKKNGTWRPNNKLKRCTIKPLRIFSKEVFSGLKNVSIYIKTNFNITCGIGMAFYPKDGKTVDELMKSSDIALYQAKEADGNNYKIYSSENNEGNENIQNCL